MRKHGWELPYHPLQVVAVAVFLALAFAFYVFFAPFVGMKILQYVAMGLYTPLILSVFGLYVWCAAADPADPGVFKSKKYLKIPENKKHRPTNSKLGGESSSSRPAITAEDNSADKHSTGVTETRNPNPSTCCTRLLAFLLLPFAFIFKCSGSSEESSDLQASEDGMFYCSLCEVEVFKHSKHCRVCDKCVDCFDHHCRWLNNCIGKRNYRKFFTLMVSALLLLILQWATGILVLICCFLERKRFSADITTKLGSSFSLVPFVIVVAVCTILAMVATLPLAQLFFFHILLIKKGISTYDYIIALREQEQELQGGGGQQSEQMSPASSLTGLSSASSFNTFHRGAWCTPPRLFVEDQFDVVPPENASVSSYGKRSASSFGKKATKEELVKEKKKSAPVKISPWTLARLNAEEVSRAAAQARKKSKILQPVARREAAASLSLGQETDSSFGSSGRDMAPRKQQQQRGVTKRAHLPAEPSLKTISGSSDRGFIDSSRTLAPLQLEARSAFQTTIVASPDSSLDSQSPDLHPFRVSSSGTEEARRLTGLCAGASHRGLPLSRSTSDGYEASGGEDSDRVPSRIVQRPTNWSNMLFGYDQEEGVFRLKPPSSSSNANSKKGFN